jgi:hypothetical protein
MPDSDALSYYVLTSENPKRMLLSSLKKPGRRDSWLFGRRFAAAPETPVIAPIVNGYETAEQLDYFGTPPIMSDRFHQALQEAGVDNIDVYDAVLTSDDGKHRYQGYKAFNVIGLVKAADLKKTVFAAGSASRLIDASIDSLSIDGQAARGLQLFRLAEYAGAVIVHDSIRRSLLQRGFPHVVFQNPAQFIS